jgi:membrane protein implicated in regulation of membrane protease activity
MTWWTWMILGAILLGAELLAIDAQFYLVFIGISAALVGLAGLLGIAMPEWAQWVTFGGLALVFMFTFRRALYEKVHGESPGFNDTMEGELVKMDINIAPGDDMRVKHRGSEWKALNVGDAEIVEGSRAKIVAVKGLTLHLSAD